MRLLLGNEIEAGPEKEEERPFMLFQKKKPWRERCFKKDFGLQRALNLRFLFPVPHYL